MQDFINDNDLFQLWADFFSMNKTEEKVSYNDLIKSHADNYPDERSLVIDFKKVFEYSTDLSEFILNFPEQAIRVGESAIISLMDPDQKVALSLRISNLFDQQHRKIRNIRAEDMTKLIDFNDIIVTWISDVKPKLLSGVFKCNSCNFVQEIVQDSFSFTEPLECPKDEGGCGKRAGTTSFKFITQESRFIDSQRVEVQDPADTLDGREQPRRTMIRIEDDLVDTVNTGDRITMIGIPKVRQGKEKGEKSVEFGTYLMGQYLEGKEKIEDREPTEEEMIQIEWIKNNNPLELLKQSIAPSIYGYDHIKYALALQWAGGVVIILPDGSRQRGDIHLLLVGDPGTAKSKLLRAMKRLHPRAIFTSGKGVSSAGLTGAVVKKPEADNRWGIEAGTMVLADRGLHITDEFDKMSPDDRSCMHDALEDQEITIAKAGVRATMKTRCANLGASNPIKGRYKRGVPASAQFNIEPPILSRHLVFAIIDTPNKDMDTLIGDRILKNRWGTNEDITPKIEPRIWKLYWHMIQDIKPKGSKERILEALSTYVDIRMEEREEEIGGGLLSRNITARQLEDIARLAEASAKLRMSEDISKEDIKLAIDLVKRSSQDATGTTDGWGDMSVIYTKPSDMNKMDRMFYLVRIIRELQDKNGSSISKSLLKDTLEERNFDIPLDEYLKRAKEEGAIYEPRVHEYAVM